VASVHHEPHVYSILHLKGAAQNGESNDSEMGWFERHTAVYDRLICDLLDLQPECALRG
jgi:hypothetical protein